MFYEIDFLPVDSGEKSGDAICLRYGESEDTKTVMVMDDSKSGPKARPMKPEWVLDIKTQCYGAVVHFFFKQWGGVNKNKAGRLLKGRTWDELLVIRLVV